MDISIKMILQELVRRIWIIILCAIIGFGGAFFYTKYFVAPVYETTMKMSALSAMQDADSITSVGGFINQMTLANRRVMTYLELLKTTKFYEQVAVTSNTGYSAGQIQGMLKFEQVKDMGIFSVTITGTDPQAIKMIGEAVAYEIPLYISEFQSSAPRIDVIEPPKAPSYPINQTIQSNAVKGALVGAILAIAAIAVIAYFDTHIKDEETLTQRYNIPVLGTIPDFAVITAKKTR